MNRIKGFVALVSAALVLTAGMSFGAAAFGQQQSAGPGEKIEDNMEKQEDGSSDQTKKVVLVMSKGGSAVQVSYYEKDEAGTWNQVFSADGVYGRNGGTYEKAEGDGKTPYGVYGINKAFGILDDPGCIMPYTKLTENDYWVDDPASSHYNRMVNTSETEKDWNSAEHLIKTAPYYNYALSLDYNEEAVPGKGSAIFIHCTAEGYTGSSGCICIGEEEMKILMVNADDTMKAVIVPDQEALEQLKAEFSA